MSLQEENIKIIGEIDYIVNQRMIIYCFVGELVDVEFEKIKPNLEVEKIYTVPVQYLLNNKPSYFEVEFSPVVNEQFLNEQNELYHSMELHSSKERIPYYEIQKHRLWGYTANLTERFIKIIQKSGELK